MMVPFIAALLLACGDAPPAAPASPAPDEDALATSERVTPAPVIPPPPGVLKGAHGNAWFVDIRPGDGALGTQLATQAQLAGKAGKVPFVQLYGDWCGPCRSLREAMKHPAMEEAFSGTWIVLLDTSVWADQLNGPDWVGDTYAVPAFYVLGEQGSVGAWIDGKAWKGDDPLVMAAPLQAFFRSHGAAPGQGGD